MIAPETPQELAAKVPGSLQKIQAAAISSRERSLLHTIVSWSLVRGREWAEFESGEHLGVLAGIPHRTDVWNALKLLQGAGWVNVNSHRGNWVRCRFLPQGALLEPPMKSDRAELRAAVLLAESLNTLPDGFEPGGQMRLPLATDVEHVENEIAAASRAMLEEEAVRSPATCQRNADNSAALVALRAAGVSEWELRCKQNTDKSDDSPGGLVSKTLTSPQVAAPAKALVPYNAQASTGAPARDVLQNVNTQNVLQDVGDAAGSARRFADSHKQFVFGAVEELCQRSERDKTDFEQWRWKWVARVRDHAEFIEIAAANVKMWLRNPRNKPQKSIGALIFAEARKYAAQAGKTLRSILFTLP